MLIDALKRFNADSADLEELVSLSAIGRQLVSEFQSLNVEVPEWLESQLRVIRREVYTRRADRIEKMISEKTARLEALKPAEQRRTELAEEIERLKSMQSALV